MAVLTDTDFMEMFNRLGAREMSKQTGVRERNIYYRRRSIEEKYNTTVSPPNPGYNNSHYAQRKSYPHRIGFTVKDGTILVGSDAHYWPGIISTAHRAFVHFAKELRPMAIIKNGDVIDGATISRHPPIGWESRPSLVSEIEASQDRLNEIEAATKNWKPKLIWPLGNHDMRFGTRLATVAPEYAKLNGVHLKDHFPKWDPCWSCFINDDVVVKHRFKGGIHATHNNTMWAGKTMVTGHLHSLKVTPLTDYNGTRFGVDTGTMADPQGPQFVDYTEDGPKNWRSGFAVLTFVKGRLLWPEVVHVLDEAAGLVEFRGEMLTV